MEWLGVVVSFALGFMVSAYSSRSEKKDLASRAEQRRIEAVGRYLDGLRRKLALWLIHENPSALQDAYRTVREYDAQMHKAGADRIALEHASLTAKYPLFSDFDLVGLKHFVPFGEHGVNEFEAVQRYMDISKFLALLSIMYPYSNISPFSDKDEEGMERIIQKSRDADLRREIDAAMGRYYAFRQSSDKDEFSDRDYEVTQIHDAYQPDIRYGVIVKANGRRGVYSFFVGDDKTYERYEEADEEFKRVRSLRRA